MLIAQEAKQPITKLQYIVKETYLTLIRWFAWFGQPKSQKSPRQDLRHSGLSPRNKTDDDQLIGC